MSVETMAYERYLEVDASDLRDMKSPGKAKKSEGIGGRQLDEIKEMNVAGGFISLRQSRPHD